MPFNPTQGIPTMRPQRVAGFTLAEVIVAVLILGVASTVLGRAVNDAMRAYSQSRQTDPYGYPMLRVRAHVLTLTSREQIEAGGEMEVPTVVRGDTTDEVQTEMLQLRWEAEIEPTRLLNVYQLALRVQIEGASDTVAIDSKLIAYRSTWGEADEVERLIESKEDTFQERLNARGDNPMEGVEP